jgi:hypothetical protein
MGAAIGRCVLVVFIAVGCGQGTAGPAGAPSRSTPDGEDTAESGDPVVTLVEPGEEPRSPLRYRFTAGRRTTMFVDMELVLSIAMGASSKKTVSTPPLRMVFAVEVLDVMAPSGAAHIRTTVESVEVRSRASDPHDMIESLRRETSALRGLTTDARISQRGFARDFKSNVPSDVSPKLRSAVESTQSACQQLVAPFPTEPVGLGAHWRVESNATTSDIAFKQRTLVTLVERDEHRVVLSFTIDQVAPKQRLKVPDLPPGATSTLENYKGHGNGRSEAPLDFRTPTAEMTVRSSFVSAVAMGEERLSVSNEMEMVMKISPTPPSPPR